MFIPCTLRKYFSTKKSFFAKPQRWSKSQSSLSEIYCSLPVCKVKSATTNSEYYSVRTDQTLMCKIIKLINNSFKVDSQIFFGRMENDRYGEQWTKIHQINIRLAEKNSNMLIHEVFEYFINFMPVIPMTQSDWDRTNKFRSQFYLRAFGIWP